MNARETAEALGVAERTVRRWITAGRLEAHKNGRGFDIDLEAAREAMGRSRAGQAVVITDALAEMRGRYLEVCERLARAEAELATERAKRIRAQRVLDPKAGL